MQVRWLRLLSGATLIALASCSEALAQFDQLLNRVPGDANMLLIVDVERLHATPLANREKWRTKLADDFSQGRIFVPPQAQRVVVASRLDIQEMEPAWQLALMDVSKTVNLQSIANKEKGYVDDIAGQKVAWSPRGGYVAKVAANSIGIMFPANRQYLSSWLRGRNGQLSTYLRQTAKRTGHVVMALDLEDALSPQLVQDRLKQFKAFAGATGNVEELAAVLSSIRGVTLELTVGEKAEGKVTVEFGRDATILADVAKPALLEVLSRQGAYIDEFEGWIGTVRGKEFSLTGTLGKSGLLRLSSVVELPSLPLDDPGRDKPKVDAGDPKLYASQQHFKSVQALLQDVRNQKGIDVKTMGQLALWIDGYARRIDRLPLLNVDEEMQDYSAEIAGLLRKLSAGYKGYGIKSSARQAQYHSGVSGTYSGYGYGSYTYSGSRYIQGERRRVKAEERAAAATTAVQLWEAIEQATSDVRQEMTKRYNVEF